jgi:hypothetical protein
LARGLDAALEIWDLGPKTHVCTVRRWCRR